MASEWDSGTEYVCLVEDSELPTPVKASIRKANVSQMHPPKVYLLHPSTDEIVTENSATLMCLATNFYPAEIYVGWMANDTLLDSGYRTQGDSEKGNGSSFVTSRLRLTAAEWNSDTTYSCLVGHPSLNRDLIRSTNKSNDTPEIMESPEDHGTEEDELENVNEDANSSLSIMTFVILFILSMLYSTFVTVLKVN